MSFTENIKKTKSYKFKFGKGDIHHPDPVIKSLVDRFHHTYIIGKTGMGKSSLMERMANTDIHAGHAVIYIDPKGESTKRLYALAPDKDKVTYISINNPKVINPLDNQKYQLDEVITEFVQILDVLITLTASNPESTVLMREIIGMAIRAIFKDEDKNIEYLVNFLLYDSVRLKALPHIRGESVRRYWTEFDAREIHSRYPKNKDKQESAKRVASRLLEISEGRMRNFVIGKNELDISDIVSSGKIILVDTSKMSMNARIYLSNLIVYSVLSYCEFSEIEPKPLFVYVDEFQIVVSQWFSDLLARSRSKQVGFTLAHQSFAQIPPKILSVILDTVNTIVCYRTGDEVAERLCNYFGISQKDLFNLRKFSAWVRIGIDNCLVDCLPPLETPLNVTLPKSQISQESAEIIDFLSDEWIIV